MYNLDAGLVAKIQRAQDVASLGKAALEALSAVGIDLDRLFTSTNGLKRSLDDQEARLRSAESEIQRLAYAVSQLGERVKRLERSAT